MKDATKRNLLLVTGGRIALLGVWFIGNIILMRQLGAEAFGIYALAVAAIKIFTGCFGDALDLSVMREVPMHLKENRSIALDVLRSSFWLRVMIGALVLLIVAILPSQISRLLLNDEANIAVAVLIGIGIVADMLSKSSMGYLQASEHFSRFILLEAFLQVGRFAAVLILIWLGRLTAISAVSIFAIAPLIVFVCSLAMLPGDLTKPRRAPRKQMTEMIHYAKWIAFSMAMAALYERVDMLLLGSFRGTKEVGFYSAAMTLATIPDHFSGCLSTVFSPKVPGLHVSGKFRRFTLQYFSYAGLVAMCGIVGAWLLGTFVIETFLSAKYAGSILAFKILATGSLIGLVLNPLPNALVAFVAPRRLSIVTAGGLIASVAGGVVFIPKYGLIGAAVLIVSIRVGIAVIMTVISLVLAYKQDAKLASTIKAPSTDAMPISAEGQVA